jgi:ABC-type spermidine/putrescine transport system permease subunit II
VTATALPATEARTTRAAASTPRKRRRFDTLTLGLGIWTVIVYGFLFLPITFVVIHSFTDSRDFTRWGGFTTRWYTRLFDNHALKNSLTNSLKVAVLATLISVVLGGLAGIALARRPGIWTKAFLGLIFLILVTPEIVDAIGLQIWFVNLGGIFRRGLFPLWFGQSIFSSAVVTLIVRARMAGLDESLEEAAADLYAPPARAFRQITLPLVFPALLAGGLLAFTFSLDNVIVSQFVSVAGTTTFPVYVFSSVRQVIRPDIGAASTIMLGLTLLALALVVVVLKRSGDSSSEIAATITGAGG